MQIGSDLDGNLSTDNAGHAIGLSSDGQVLAMGAPFNNANGPDSGSVRLFNYVASSGTWDQFGFIFGEDADVWSGFSVALNGDGTVVAIGAIRSRADNQGRARVFEYAGGFTWNQRGGNLNGQIVQGAFGSAIALSTDGNVVAVGDRNSGGQGEVKVFDWNGSSWTQRGVTIQGQQSGDKFGETLTLSGTGLVVAGGGTSYNAGGNSNAGHASVYEWDGSAWVLRGSHFLGSVGAERVGSGVSLSDDGSVFALGARGANTSTGRCRVYTWNGSAWVQKGQDLSGSATEDRAGASVWLTGDGSAVAFGATQTNSGGPGYVRVYDYVGSTWVQKASDIIGEANGDEFGSSLAISDDASFVAVGAPFNDSGGKADAGSVRAFEYFP